MTRPDVAGETRIEGDRLYLRDVRPEDVTERYLAWMNDPDVTRYLETRFGTHTMESLRAFVDDRQRDPATLFLAIIRRDTGEHIGNIKLGPINLHHEVADIGLIVGERSAWGQGFATEAIAALTRYAFETLRLRRLTAGAYAPNIGSVRAFEKAGYRREGLRRQHYACDGAYVDGILLGRLRDEAGGA